MLSSNQVHQGDCIDLLAKIEADSVHLAFADPPFNIGYDYDVYHDRKAHSEYLDWSRQWISGVHRALKPDGTFWLAIGDEYAAQLKLISQEVGFHCRSWVIWYYTFGINCTRKFNRSHAHLLHFVKNPKKFTFNFRDPSIRVPSARQLVYADARANPLGRLPDDTWILRPQDVSDGFSAEQDTWYFPRVAGTFKERAGFHGCQMPEQLLGRIVRSSSNKDDLVLDPFTGSGTTLVVAKKLGRDWIGFELSKQYAKQAGKRIERATTEAALEGPENPLLSAPTTPRGRVLESTGKKISSGKALSASTLIGPDGREYSEEESMLVLAYLVASAGYSSDQMLADPDLNEAFCEQCRVNGLPGMPARWFHRLLNLRKAGRLPKVEIRRHRSLQWRDIDPYCFASEIAWQAVEARRKLTSLDEVLCDPSAAAEFDRIAARYAPGFKPFEYRWAALRIRKRADKFRAGATQACRDLGKRTLPPLQTWRQIDFKSLAPKSGIYIVADDSEVKHYVGATFDLRGRLDFIAQQSRPLKKLAGVSFVEMPEISNDRLRATQSWLIGTYHPLLNSKRLAYAPQEANSASV